MPLSGGALVERTARMEEPDAGGFPARFDRSEAYRHLLRDIDAFVQGLTDSGEEPQKTLRKLRKTYASIVGTDFFPGESQRQAEAALLVAEETVARLLSPDEPCATIGVTSVIQGLSVFSRKLRIFGTTSSISNVTTVTRNMDEMPEAGRPCLVLIDGDETRSDTSRGVGMQLRPALRIAVALTRLLLLRPSRHRSAGFDPARTA